MTTDQNEAPSQSSQRRVLGPTTAMLLTTAMIFGSGLFAALGATAEKAGSGLLLSIVLSGLVALATGLSAASVGINFPEEGGGFTWSRKFGHNTLGFIAGCAYLGSGIVSTVVISLAFAIYTTEVVGGLPSYAMHVIASAAIILVATINGLGLQLNAKLLIILLFIQLVLLAVFVGFAAPAVQAENLLPVLGENGASGVLAGAAIFFWSWGGFMRAAIMASEVKEPRRSIPFAVVGSIAFSGVVFLVIAAVALGVLGAEGMRGGEVPSDTPLLAAAAKGIGKWGVWIVLATAWIDTLAQAMGELMSSSRVALAMGKEHELPAWVAALHPRFRSPQHALIALGLVCAVLALFVKLRAVLLISNVFILVWYSVVHFDALQLPKEKRLVWPVVSWLGLAGCMALFASLPVRALATGGGTLALLVAIRWLVNRYQESPRPT